MLEYNTRELKIFVHWTNIPGSKWHNLTPKITISNAAQTLRNGCIILKA